MGIRIIQKYLEHPYLLHLPSEAALTSTPNSYKFDIRQWVMLGKASEASLRAERSDDDNVLYSTMINHPLSPLAPLMPFFSSLRSSQPWMPIANQSSTFGAHFTSEYARSPSRYPGRDGAIRAATSPTLRSITSLVER